MTEAPQARYIQQRLSGGWQGATGWQAVTDLASSPLHLHDTCQQGAACCGRHKLKNTSSAHCTSSAHSIVPYTPHTCAPPPQTPQTPAHQSPLGHARTHTPSYVLRSTCARACMQRAHTSRAPPSCLVCTQSPGKYASQAHTHEHVHSMAPHAPKDWDHLPHPVGSHKQGRALRLA